MLPRESMGMQFSKLNERYAVDSVLADRKEQPVVYRLVLHPRDERSTIRKVRFLVHGERWTPERIEIPQADGRAMVATFTYANSAGFWLPSELVVHFDAGAVDSTARAPANPFGGAEPPGRGQVRGGGRAGTITVRYSEYRVNTGLKDDIFVKQGEPK
jgi:outer membrane lipoprotein-sorting protein